MSLASLLEDIAALIGGPRGALVRLVARIIREQERFNSNVALRIEQERRNMMQAGAAAHEASRFAGRSSTGSGAR